MKEETMKRDNSDKPPMEYLGDIKEALEELCRVFDMGTKKYGRANWKKGGDRSMLMGCLGRHFLKLASGETVDEESGYSHAAHLAWNALAYMQLEHEGKLK